jgi:hypothetical protein
MARFRRSYGAGFGHLAGFLLALTIAGLAVRRIFDANTGGTGKVFVWLVGAIVVHDLVLLPLYSLIDRVLSRRPAAAPGPARFAALRTHIRVPALLSALLLLVFGPLILRKSTDYAGYSSLSTHPFLHRWLIATAVLFGLSAAVYAARIAARARRVRGRRTGRGRP